MTASVEAIARIIEPYYWKCYDRTLIPFAENRGAYSSVDDCITYRMMWEDGVRTVEDAKNWWAETDRPVMVRQEQWRDSIVRAKKIVRFIESGVTDD